MAKVYSVSEITSYLKGLFSRDPLLKSLSVSGELSNVKYHSSGHIYFTIKDEGASLSGVMFQSDARSLHFRLADGLKVEITGFIGVYDKAGSYQIYARQIKREGRGELYEKYLKLKDELEERGMFADEYKQAIPEYIKRLGVVTAATGAAVRDIINITRRRNPYVEIVLYPAKVQGEGAAESVARGIDVLDKAGVDVIIAGRGGGSIEDLWAFNEITVAEAIFHSRTPVISAVGHETDTTIADFVA
ncbi:MAG: exodeoxyribonuclease VII large subunit, partial [Lachnospiraceae bacterium]|nr:exodeoxyribonuclease VII large subunit [Lachnospiraceae bacterium]